MQKTKKFKKQANGITLIALVITIIVLLILVGVSISTLTGQNGILSQATNAKDKTKIAHIQEEIDLWKMSQLAGEYGVNETTETQEEMLNRLVNQKVITSTEKNKILNGGLTIRDRTITLEITLVDLFNKAQEDECTNDDGKCQNENHLHIGDYVSYTNPTSGSKIISAEETGIVDEMYHEEEMLPQTFEVSKNQLNWRVLGLDDETGGLKLIAGSPIKSNNKTYTFEDPYLYLYGAKGYINGPEIMNEICGMYTTEYGTARSITQKDIDNVLGITTQEQIKAINIDHYGKKSIGEIYSFENRYTPETWIEKEQTGIETAGTISGVVDGYNYYILKDGQGLEQEEDGNIPYATTSNRIYEMLFENTKYKSGRSYWVASRSVRADLDGAYFYLGMVSEQWMLVSAGTDSIMFSSAMSKSSYGNGNCAAVRPVVCLKSNVTPSSGIQKIEDKIETIWDCGLPE